MKIVHLARLFAPHIGGVETHVREISRELTQAGHELTIITQQHEATLPLTEIIDDVTIIRIPADTFNSKLQTWKALWHHRQLWQTADVVHVHDVFWWLLPFTLLIKDKLFMTFHGWEGQYPVRWQAKAQRWFAHKLAVKSIHVGEWIQEFYWDKPDAVTYGGVNSVSTSHSKTLPSVNFAFLGRLSKDNDVPLYLEVLDVLKQHSKKSVSWLGDGELRAECEQYGEVKGFVKNPAYFLQSADFAFASSYLSILEAQSLGKVVVAMYSNPLKKRYLETYPGVPHMIIGHDPTQVAHAVKELQKNRSKYNQLSQAALSFAKTQTWKQVSDLYLTLWQQEK